MNILLLSVGTRNKVVKYFKDNIKGRVIATDMSRYAPAIYEADKHYIVPSIKDKNYLKKIYSICKKEKVTGVLSLIDPELSLLALHKKDFEKIGVEVIGSSYDLCELSLNKWNMYLWLKEHKYNCAKSYIDIKSFVNDLNNKKIKFPVFVKPICGSASILINKVDNLNDVKYLFSKHKNLMIQEYLGNQEIGADVYIDSISHEVVSIFTKKKILMRSGETDKAISFKDKKLFDLIEKFILEAGYEYQIDIDIFKKNGKYYISEVNPRFGGGYPHAQECGCNHIKLITNNLNKINNKKSIGKYKENVLMMKYNEVKVCKI